MQVYQGITDLHEILLVFVHKGFEKSQPSPQHTQYAQARPTLEFTCAGLAPDVPKSASLPNQG
jgi:hypothetical protein